MADDEEWFTASCHCGFTTNRYGTQAAADAALARHQEHLGH